MDRYDVVICGGGLAGLTLARQLKRERPDLSIFLAEKRAHPVPEAAFKVGESSVEIGAHYFRKVLDLEAHLREGHLEKLGIRYFFPYGDNTALERRVEVGPRTFPPVPSFQIDRGRLENWLLRNCSDLGVAIESGASISSVTLDDDAHAIAIRTTDRTFEVAGRWLVDASGRTGLLRRKLGLTRAVNHLANASWFRVAERLKVDDWGHSEAWKARVPSGERWLSTNHLMGRGYWVWLIPLGSGSTSVGIVADARLHPFDRINRLERALDWLREFEPQCGRIVEAKRHRIEDFLALKHYAYGAARVFSRERWLLAGEAGLFTDPFYSPGSDFIAIGNDFICDLILRDRAGEEIAGRLETFNATYLRLFDAFIRLYEGQYRLMGNAQVMTLKAAWDNGCYWAITGLLYFQRRYRDAPFLQSIEPLMRRFFVLHARIQALLRAWDEADPNVYADAWRNVLSLDFLRTLQSELASPPYAEDALRRKLDENLDLLEQFAQAIQAVAARTSTDLTRFVAPRPGEPLDIGPLVLSPADEPHRHAGIVVGPELP